VNPLFHILILAVLQGFTEFLPVSSSGHLVVVNAILTHTLGEPPAPAAGIIIFLHAGTLASILVVYWRRIWRLVGEDRRVIGRLVVGTLPAAAVGLLLKSQIEQSLESPLVAGLMLPVTGLMLLWAARRPVGETDYRDLSYGRVLIIGCLQAVAILPGISRSGATIAAGMGVGLRRSDAATFSFLLAIPAISGAIVLELKDMVAGNEALSAVNLLVIGALVSFVVGTLALWWLIRWLEKGRIQYFAWWCIPVGLGIILWQVLQRTM